MSIKITDDSKKPAAAKTAAKTTRKPAAAEEPMTRKEAINDQEYRAEREKQLQDLIKKVDDLTKEKEAANLSGLDADGIAKIIKATKGDDKYERRLISTDEIDPDDELEVTEAVSFFAPTAFYVIVDDVRQNRAVYPPISEAITFEYAGEDRVMTEKGPTYNVYSQYVSRSKQEVEWLRNHRLFNIVFFENMKNAIDMDQRVFKALHQAMSSVQSMEPNTVRDYLKAEGVPPGTSHENNKRLLAFEMAKKIGVDLASKDKKLKMYDGDGRQLDSYELLQMEKRTPIKQT